MHSDKYNNSFLIDSNSFWIKKDLNNYSAEGSFIIVKKDKLKVKTLKIQHEYIQYSKNKVIHIKNAILEQCTHIDVPLNGFQLSKGNHRIQFFGQYDEFMKLLKKYVIQLNFQSNYLILSQISQISAVYTIKQKLTGLIKVAKVFAKPKLNKLHLQALKQEISILQQIDHPNLVDLLEIYESENNVILVFEQFQGGELSSFLQKSCFPELEVKRIMKPLFRAVSYLHSKNIFHRDIKLTNILLKDKKKLHSVTLIDFGLADYYSNEANYLFLRCGTPGFVAPEILQDKPYNLKVDVFSLGIVMYMLCTGVQPFDGINYDDKVSKNYFGQIEMENLDVSPECLDFMTKILQNDPKKRFTADEALQHSFFSRKPYKVGTLIGERQTRLPQIRQLTISPLMSMKSRSPQMYTNSKLKSRSPSPAFKLQQKLKPIENKLSPSQLYQLI